MESGAVLWVVVRWRVPVRVWSPFPAEDRKALSRVGGGTEGRI